MKRVRFLEGACAATALTSSNAPGAAAVTEGAGIRVPDTPLARDANDAARSAENPAIYNHSLRSFLFAELIAEAKHIDRDSELVYVAAMMHDIGLSPKYSSEKLRFEVDGANASRDLLARHGKADSAADLVWDAIALHGTSSIARWKQPEVMLVNAGVVTDVAGAYLGLLKTGDVTAVLRSAPRAGFVEAFLDALTTLARKKPLSTAGTFVADVGYRRVAGFHLPNFCDELKDDPFEHYSG
ncbi:MAG: HD domain-containing protein [Vulcanimicrobiaceae bacterium]